MVRQNAISVLACIVMLCCPGLSSGAAFAAELTARLSAHETQVNQVVELEVVLSGASSREQMQLPSLGPSLHVRGRNSMTQLQIVNGTFRQNMMWKYRLAAEQPGTYTIPSITLKTSAGVLRTGQLRLKVVPAGQGSAVNPQAQQRRRSPAQPAPPVASAELPVETSVAISDSTPYVGQPVKLMITIRAGQGLDDLILGEPEIEGARVEMAGDPVGHNRRHMGKRVVETVVTYLVTPLREGAVTIPPIPLTGVVFRPGGRNPFPPIDKMDDPFALFDSMMKGIMGREPFELLTDEVSVRVQPVPEGWKAPAKAWLPLETLEVSQKVDAVRVEAGNPVTRTITMVARGGYPEALPNLEPLQRARIDEDAMQLYVTDTRSDGEYSANSSSLHGWKEQRFTFVPLQAGSSALPEIRIPWWNVNTDKMEYAVLPAVNIQVSGGVERQQDQPMKDAAKALPEESAAVEDVGQREKDGWLLGAVLLIVLAGGAVMYGLWRYRNRPARAKPRVSKQDNAVTLGAISAEANPEKAYALLNTYMESQLGSPSSLPLSQKIACNSRGAKHTKREKSVALAEQLEQSLYGGAALSQAEWTGIRDALCTYIKGMEKSASHRQKSAAEVATLPPLNP